MTNSGLLRLMVYVCMAFALVLAIWTLTSSGRDIPSLPAFLTFLFVGLIGSYAASSIRELEKRVENLEQRERK